MKLHDSSQHYSASVKKSRNKGKIIFKMATKNSIICRKKINFGLLIPKDFDQYEK
jgi:hypothetical protein